jgi:phage tail-like protein
MAITTQLATNVKATPSLIPNVIEISWDNPTDPNFDHVVVYRRVDQFQTDLASPYGVQIYSGSLTKIYDYRKDASERSNTALLYVDPNYVANPNIADIDFDSVAADSLNGWSLNLLDQGQIYYYTVFSIDTFGSVYSSISTMASCRMMKQENWGNTLWSRIPPLFQEEDGGKEFDPAKKNRGQTERLLTLFGLGFNWMNAKISAQTTYMNVDNCEAQFLDYIAAVLGWELDKSMSISSQRTILKNAVRLYKLAGTRLGLDLLVKYHSGFPNSSGVSENSNILLETPLFTNSQIYYTDRVAPDLDHYTTTGLDYTYDFSSTNVTGTSSFIAYVQPTYTLTNDQVITIENRLTKVLDKFVPTGVTYTISIF